MHTPEDREVSHYPRQVIIKTNTKLFDCLHNEHEVSAGSLLHQFG